MCDLLDRRGIRKIEGYKIETTSIEDELQNTAIKEKDDDSFEDLTTFGKKYNPTGYIHVN